jgi:hypothetical protein
MDTELIKLIQQAVREGITANSWIVLIAGLIGAGTGAFFGAYFRKKGEHFATKEDFDELLEQQKEQTRITEEIRGEILHNVASFTDLIFIPDELHERFKEVVHWMRETIAAADGYYHLNREANDLEKQLNSFLLEVRTQARKLMVGEPMN